MVMIAGNSSASVSPANAVNASRVRLFDLRPQQASLQDEALTGLRRQPKSLSPKWFYDGRGAALFDAICRTPEYYPTRTEMAIFQRYGEEMGEVVGDLRCLVEPGAGNCTKAERLLQWLQPEAFVAIDICKDYLLEAGQRLTRSNPELQMVAACADFSQFHELEVAMPDGRRVIFFPGSTIGNLEPDEATGFLQSLAEFAGPGGGLLIGVDVRKDAGVLHRAYNDAAGVTAAFNLNLLERMNRELEADFVLEQFEHHAFYNEDQHRIEMHLRSRCAQQVSVAGTPITFERGETLHTENSYKHSIEAFHLMARRAGWRPREVWQDREHLFSVHYLEVDDAIV